MSSTVTMGRNIKRNRLDLPVELERIIFELAARADIGTALKLVRVAHRVRDWVEPIIYQTVVVSRPSEELRLFRTERPMFRRRNTKAARMGPPTLPFIRTLAHRPQDFFARHVHTLHLANLNEFELMTVLSSCTGVTELGWQNCTLMPEVAILVNALELTRLSIDPTFCDFARLQTTITHLDMTVLPPEGILKQFVALTHLSLSAYAIHPPNWREATFAACKKLAILLHISADALWGRMGVPAYQDDRLVELPPPVRGSEVSIAHDLWPVAEEIVRGRKAFAEAERRKAEEEAKIAADGIQVVG
ncbi:hypothetical protein HMN09_00254000 [Mycena chlorophos]|uniref:F-box domain-containing protein n=1 Tax=Mycena chlorophos TaxID=658473 RepID=A0A8H6THT9_MYCCL|nr:hypothetical protein HMN09_00254000 [Mycena chlorophos]